MYAIGVVAEDPTTTQHAARLLYAQQIINDPMNTTALVPLFRTLPEVTGTAGDTSGDSGSPLLDTQADTLIAAQFDNFRRYVGIADDPE